MKNKCMFTKHFRIFVETGIRSVSFTLKMEAARSTGPPKRWHLPHHNAEDLDNPHCCENLKPRISKVSTSEVTQNQDVT